MAKPNLIAGLSDKQQNSMMNVKRDEVCVALSRFIDLRVRKIRLTCVSEVFLCFLDTMVYVLFCFIDPSVKKIRNEAGEEN